MNLSKRNHGILTAKVSWTGWKKSYFITYKIFKWNHL